MKHPESDFCKKHLPKPAEWPEIILNTDQFAESVPLNSAVFLLDRQVSVRPEQRFVFNDEYALTYKEIDQLSSRMAQSLILDYGLEKGDRVVLRSANNPKLCALWLAILKAGGVVVATMPLLRHKELQTIIDCSEARYIICDRRLQQDTDDLFGVIKIYFDGSGQNEDEFERAIRRPLDGFSPIKTFSDEVAIIGFTSGTTGLPKMTAHFHRDLVNICRAFPEFALQASSTDIFSGSPPLAFTFGLGGLLLFPLWYGASSYLIEQASPDALLKAVQKHKVSVLFTAPTAWRALCERIHEIEFSSLRRCVSAGETLPAIIWERWKEKTGLEIIDGIGSTEMLHIFISNAPGYTKPGSTGKVVPGYQATIVNDQGKELPSNTMGRLAVKGITGCRYLNRPEKQREYVKSGWNLTGDLFIKDEEGYFWYVSRSDDMIISSGYNIAAIEVESVLLQHPLIKECAVIGEAHEERGAIVSAFIVLKNHEQANENLATEIQDWFKQTAAPYKYPRKISFVSELPKTETGKIQRFRLKTAKQTAS